MPDQEKKPIWLSKTIYFNVLAFIVAIAVVFGYQGELPPEWEKWVTVVIAIVNLALRFWTKQPVKIK